MKSGGSEGGANGGVRDRQDSRTRASVWETTQTSIVVRWRGNVVGVLMHKKVYEGLRPHVECEGRGDSVWGMVHELFNEVMGGGGSLRL